MTLSETLMFLALTGIYEPSAIFLMPGRNVIAEMVLSF
jgi:hypothetical protein